MTLGVAYGNSVSNLSALMGEREDRRTMQTGMIHVSPSFEIVTDDPSGGANYSGGSSYVPGMPLTASNAGLAGMPRDLAFGAMSYHQAMDWSPAPMTEHISALKAGAGRTFAGFGEAKTFNPVWVAIGAAAIAWWFFGRKERAFGR